MSTEPIAEAQAAQNKPHAAEWVTYYTGAVTAMGVCIAFYFFGHLPTEGFGLVLFALAAALVELTSVELYINSRSRVSVSTIIAIAAVVVFGPAGGALIQLASGLMTALTTSLLQKEKIQDGSRASTLQRLAFNTGMFVTAAGLAGLTYTLAGGTPGDVLRWHNLIPLILAVTIDNLVNILLLMGVIWLQTGRSLREIWRQEFAWGVPIALVGGFLGGAGLAIGFATFGAGGLVVFMLPVLATGYAFRTYVDNTREHVDKLEALNRKLDGMNQQLEQSNLELLQTLGAIVDAFDTYTYGHSNQVAFYGQAIAEQMGLPLDLQERILRGGLIHDIGKVGIKDAIISKPGRLTDEEFEAIKQHPVIGDEIVSQMTGLRDLRPLVRSHHERWDGRGYPDGLLGTETPLEARILAVADSVDAMLSARPYKEVRSITDVVKEVIRCSGSQYDPAVVQAFVRVYESKGNDFFLNSATHVDRALTRNGIAKPSEDLRYLKKSMIRMLSKQ